MNGSEKWRKWLQLWRKKHFIKINFYFLFSIVCNVWFVSLSFTFHFQHDFSFARITCWEGHKFSKEATLRWITSERKGDCRISYTHKWKSVPRHSHQRWKMKFNSIEKIFRKISNEKSFEEKQKYMNMKHFWHPLTSLSISVCLKVKFNNCEFIYFMFR